LVTQKLSETDVYRLEVEMKFPAQRFETLKGSCSDNRPFSGHKVGRPSHKARHFKLILAKRDSCVGWSDAAFAPQR